MGIPVMFTRCGTRNDWERNKDKYLPAAHVIPCELYITEEDGVCLVTSKEWVDYLLGRRDTIPDDMG